MNVINALIEGVTQDLIAYLVEDRKIEIAKAMDMVYNSTTYEKLTDPDTGLYREGSAYVYELLKDELSEGKLIQKEI
jgi:hypothetical protein